MTIETFKIASSEQGREEQAAALPRQLIQYLSAGEDGPGLTLTREHMATLDEYSAEIAAIPSARQPLMAWLGYSTHADVELAVDAMQRLFGMLRVHAAGWPALRACCLGLPSELGVCARAIEHCGEQALLACEKTKALGGRREAWASVQFEAPVVLSAADKVIVADLIGLLGAIQVEVARFHARVTALCTGIEAFRDKAKYDYRPLLWRKIEAIRRIQDHPDILRFRLAIERLDVRIENLQQMHAKSVREQASTDRFALEFREVQRRIREEADELRRLRISLSADLERLCRNEGRLQGLATRLDQLITRMQDVTTSAAHLHTAWQLIGVYIETSIERLHTLHNSQQLGIFVIHFKNFLSQWAFIEQCAIALEKRLQ